MTYFKNSVRTKQYRLYNQNLYELLINDQKDKQKRGYVEPKFRGSRIIQASTTLKSQEEESPKGKKPMLTEEI